MGILFHSDWQYYKNSVLDTESNPSFVRYAALLREMGVKNHSFCLSLTKGHLLGKSPYDPHLTPQDILDFSLEFAENPWSFFRMVARDPAGSEEMPLLLQMNRGLGAMYWLFFCHVVPLVVMIRQTGKSFGLTWLNMYLTNICKKMEVSILTKDEKLRAREVERYKSMELTVPWWMKRRSSKDPGNTEVIKISGLENYIKLYVPNKSPKIADIIGRGMTSPIVIADEFAYLFNNFITVPVMLSATLAARETKKMLGEPYGNVFCTTSGKRDTPEGKYAYKMFSESYVFNEKLFDCENFEDLYQTIEKGSENHRLMVNCTFNHRQLGKTDEWLAGRLKDSVQEDPIQIQADYFNTWPSGTTSSPFSQEIAEAIRNSESLDVDMEITSGLTMYSLRWYYSEKERAWKLREPHVLGIDPSDAIGRDAIGHVLRNVSTGEVAMVSDIGESNLITYCQWLVEFIVEHPSITVIIERRGSGSSILDYLLMYLPMRAINPFTRLYNKVVQEKDQYPQRYKEAMKSFRLGEPYVNPTYKALFGWATSGGGATSRTELYSKTLTQMAKLTGSLTRDRKLILQLLGLTIRNGRVDHEEGEHDDLVISSTICFWLLQNGRNLIEYGIEPHRILSDNPVYLQNAKIESSYDRQKHHEAKERINALSEQIRQEKDEYLIKRLEYDLIKAVSELSEQDQQTIVADDLITKLREERSHAREVAARKYGGNDYDFGYNRYSASNFRYFS